MDFEWDVFKSERNRRDRGLDFEYATRAFEGRMVVWTDTRRDYGELREIGMGEIEGRVFVLVWTWRGTNRCRIISARRANAKETQRYYEGSREVFRVEPAVRIDGERIARL